MLTGLLLTAFLMGLGGIPHCAAMCGAACAVAFPRGLPAATWFGRLLGYATLGGAAAVSAGLVSQWGREVAMLKPLWVMAQVAVVILGMHLLIRGRMPAWLDGAGRGAYDAWRARAMAWPEALSPFWRGLWRAAWPFVGGLSWALLPCGLLYAALMVAALAPDAWGGAMVMLAFGVPSAVGVWAAPWLMRRWVMWRRSSGEAGAATTGDSAAGIAPGVATVPVIWMRPGGEAPRSQQPLASGAAPLRSGESLVDPRWAVRVSGLGLALMGAWSVWHQLVAQWQAWCA